MDCFAVCLERLQLTIASWLTAALIAPTVLGAQASSDCGCRQPVAFTDTLESGGRQATVVASIISAEGSPRAAHPANAEDGHPYPWLRYLLAVEKRWGDAPDMLWIERPWSACGSVLNTKETYLIALPAPSETNRTAADRPTFTVDTCASVLPLAEAEDVLSDLGAPDWKRESTARAMHPVLAGLLEDRDDCIGIASVDSARVRMVPGEPMTLSVGFRERGARAAARHDFTFAQDATRAEGRGEILVQAHNPTGCWLRIVPEIESTWNSESGIRRAFPPNAGLTFHEGYVPPYWAGVLSVDRDSLWVRDARWQITGLPLASQAKRSENADGNRQRVNDDGPLIIESIEPPAGSELSEGKATVRAVLRWRPSRPETSFEDYRVVPLLIAKDGTMSMRGGPRNSLATPVPSGTVSSSDGIEMTIEHDLRRSLSAAGPAESIRLVFSIQKPLNIGSERSPTTIVAMTQPIEYRRAVNLPSEPLPKPAVGPYYSGGSGETCEDAIVVNAASTVQQGISMQHNWFRKVYPGSTMTSSGVQPPSEEGGRAFDTLTLQLPDGSERKACFDITSFWGAPAR